MKLLATTVVHVAQHGESHGGAYLVDLDRKSVHQVISRDAPDIEWYGIEGGRGLRGIALHGDRLYVTAGDELLAYDREFKFINSWRCPYLVNGHGLSVYQGNLFIASSGNDCIVAFNLEARTFEWAMWVQSEHFRFKAVTFDPMDADGPLCLDKLHLKQVRCSERGMHMGGGNTAGLLHFNGKEIRMSVELPAGAQDVEFFRSGVVFNDSRAGVVRYAGDDEGYEDRGLRVPYYTESDHGPSDSDAERILRRGYARGLCVISDTVVAAGCTPASVSIYELRENERLLTVSLTRDVRTAINCIQRWLD